MQPSTPSSDWKIHIYRVRSEWHQQRILTIFHRVARPGLTALGTRSGPDWFVVVESGSLASSIHAARIITTIDPRAVRTYEYESRPEDARTRPPGRAPAT